MLLGLGLGFKANYLGLGFGLGLEGFGLGLGLMWQAEAKTLLLQEFALQNYILSAIVVSIGR